MSVLAGVEVTCGDRAPEGGVDKLTVLLYYQAEAALGWRFAASLHC